MKLSAAARGIESLSEIRYKEVLCSSSDNVVFFAKLGFFSRFQMKWSPRKKYSIRIEFSDRAARLLVDGAPLAPDNRVTQFVIVDCCAKQKRNEIQVADSAIELAKTMFVSRSSNDGDESAFAGAAAACPRVRRRSCRCRNSCIGTNVIRSLVVCVSVLAR